MLRTHKDKQKIWDSGGDTTDPIDGMWVLEIANLSYDEPELEKVFVEDVLANVNV